jgi:hypothetical protein
MKRLTPLLPLALCAAFLAGCASPASGPEYSEVKGTLPAQSPDTGRIFIYRTDVLGSVYQPPVRINGDEAGTARIRGFFYVDLPAGRYRIDTGSKDENVVRVSLAKGQAVYVRLAFSADPFGINLDPQVVDAQEAQGQIAGCRLTRR